MTRWLQAARRASGALTKPTELTEHPSRSPKAGALSVVSVLSDFTKVSVEPHARPDGLPHDPLALLDLLRREGPQTYGAAAVALGCGATRAWRAETELRRVGRIRLGPLGRAIIIKQAE